MLLSPIMDFISKESFFDVLFRNVNFIIFLDDPFSISAGKVDPRQSAGPSSVPHCGLIVCTRTIICTSIKSQPGAKYE